MANGREYAQSAVIPYRIIGSEIQILLITSSSGKRWVIPKGLVEPDMTPAQSAANEAFEEAGVRGRVNGRVIGRYRYRKWEGVCRVEVYLMRVEEECSSWPENRFRTREWVPLREAVERVKSPALKKMLSRFPGLIE